MTTSTQTLLSKRMKHRIYKIRKTLILGLLAVFAGLTPSQAQVTITTTNLPNGELGSDYASTGASVLATVSGDAVDVCWNVTNLPPGLSLSGGALSDCAATGTTINVIGMPSSVGSFFAEFTATGLDGSNNPVGTDDTATIIIDINAAAGSAVNVMMILDRSGSMNSTVPGLNVTTYGDEITSNSKWNVLKIVSNDFLAEMDQLRDEPEDQLALHLFNDSHTDLLGGFQPFDDFPISTTLDAAESGSLLEFMGDAGNQPTSMTCIGGALLTGYNDFPGDVEFGNIILFTDGMQNRDPSVSSSGERIEMTGITAGTGFDNSPLPLDLTNLGNVKVHTIHLGDNAAATLMNDVSLATGGSHFSIRNISGTESSTDQLNEFLEGWDQTLVNNLEGMSPKLGRIVSSQTKSDSTVEQFIVDNKAEMLLFKVVKYYTTASNVQIRKDGSLIYSRNQDDLVEHYRITQPMLDDLGLEMGGTWTVHLQTRKAEPYYMSLFIDEEALTFNTSIGGKQLKPGDTMPISVEMAYNDGSTTYPIADADTVLAIVAKPGQDFNDLFAEANIDLPAEPTEDDQSPGEQKFNALIQNDSEFRAALALTDQSFILTNNGNGRYTGQFTDTEESGIYRVRFFIRGTHPELGTYHRYEQKTTLIDFGEADEEQTVFQQQTINNAAQLVITPRNQFGHLIGPNRLGQIQILFEGSPLQLTDQLDGTYVAKLPADADPAGNVEVNIKGLEFYNNDLASIGTSTTGGFCHWVEAILGIPCWLFLLIVVLIAVIIWFVKKNNS